MVGVPGNAWGVAESADGEWLFTALNHDLAVLRAGAAGPRLVDQLPLAGDPAGIALSHDGRHLLVADDAGATVIDAAQAETNASGAILGSLTAPGGRGAAEVAITPDDRLAFVSLELSNTVAVFSLADALARGFVAGDYLGEIALGQAPVGLAVSPDGHWLYATSETAPAGAGIPAGDGSLSVVDISRAGPRSPGRLIATVDAGCSPVRVASSSDGRTIWVTARGSNALLAYTAGLLVPGSPGALIARVPVGSEPVGVALVDGDRRVGRRRLQPFGAWRCRQSRARRRCRRTRSQARPAGLSGGGRVPARHRARGSGNPHPRQQLRLGTARSRRSR